LVSQLTSGERGERARFCKWLDPQRPFDRGTVAYYPAELTDGVEPQSPRERDFGGVLGRRMTVRIAFGWSTQGPIGMVRRRGEALLRWAGVLPQRRPPLDA
jgi:hypothetical protein